MRTWDPADRIGLGSMLTLLLVSGLLLLTTQAGAQAPDLSELTNVRMTVVSVGLSLKRPPEPAQMEVGMRIENVRSDLLKLESMDYVLYVEDAEFCKGHYPPPGETLSIGPEGTVEFTVKVAVPLEKMMAVGQKLMTGGKRKPQCRLEGVAELRPPVGEPFSFPFIIDNIDIDLKKVKLTVDVPNQLPLQLSPDGQEEPETEEVEERPDPADANDL